MHRGVEEQAVANSHRGRQSPTVSACVPGRFAHAVPTSDTRPVITPPTFASRPEHVSRLGDVEFWWSYIAEILERHDLADAGRVPVAGFNPTYPTFVCGDVVVKLFGYSPAWRETYAAERAAHALVATDPEIAAPRVLAEGRLYDDADTPWPYLITTRMAGVPWCDAELPTEQKLAVAADLGEQVRRVHALRPSRLVATEDGSAMHVAAAAAQSSLPPHLVAQTDEYLYRLEPFDRVFVHGDLCDMHAFVENGRLTGIIDWGDAMVTDRHYELIQLYRDMFGCDKALLRVFLDACDWPVGRDFPRQALGLALYRQAVGLAQHHTMDVFEPIAVAFALEEFGTLDDLATELFAV